MDIYGAEIQVNKLLNYVKSLSDSRPRMYQKSKDRLKDLALSCNQIVTIIADILQDESLRDNSTDEFGSCMVEDVNAVLNSMQNQIHELRQFINVDTSAGSNTIVHPANVSIDSISSRDKKTAINSYKVCLHNLSNTEMIVQEAEDCSEILWRWFSSRFLDHQENFLYKITMLPNWLRDIVILYGSYLDCGLIDDFTTSFNSWIDSIDSSMPFAVPYEVHQLYTNVDTSKMTLTAVVLWDVLLDHGLRSLCNNVPSALYPAEDAVYTVVGSLNSNAMDPYTHYSYEKSILSKCNLTLKVGDET